MLSRRFHATTVAIKVRVLELVGQLAVNSKDTSGHIVCLKLTEEIIMRLLLWGLAAAALFATEPGKRLQRKAVEKFKELTGKTCSAEAHARHPEMGAVENEDENEEPRLEKETEDEKSEDDQDDEQSQDEANDRKAEDEKSGDEDEHGIDQEKVAELLEKLNAKPSAPEDELKSA